MIQKIFTLMTYLIATIEAPGLIITLSIVCLSVWMLSRTQHTVVEKIREVVIDPETKKSRRLYTEAEMKKRLNLKQYQ